jgi:O-antigen/teichoic acid export membrane protein
LETVASPLDEPQAPLPEAQPPQSLGHTTARGFVWLLMNTVSGKVVSIGQIVVTGWLLTKSDYDLTGFAATITGIAGALVSVGMEDLLVQRQKEFARWATPGFWMSLTMGMIGAGLMIAAAPLGANLYHAPRLVGLVMVACAAAPMSNLCNVPTAMLRSQLRYRSLATISWGQSTLQAVLTVLLAWRGYGAYSLVAPRPISLAAQAAVLWWMARPRVKWSLELNQWPNLFRDSAFLLGCGWIGALISNGDFMTLGILYGKKSGVEGNYYFAFNLSVTTAMMVMMNMSSVLMPTLCKLAGDPKRQMSVTLRTVRAIALVGFPLSFMQAAASEPLLHLVWREKWLNAVPILQILSFGMALKALGVPGGNLLTAQGRFKTLFMTGMACVVLFFALVIPGAMWKQGIGAAVGVTGYCLITDAGFLYLAIRPAGGTMKDIFKTSATPMAAGLLAAGLAWGAAQMIPAIWSQKVIQLAVIGVVAPVVYFVLIKTLAPADVADLVARARALMRRGSAPTAVLPGGAA